MENDLRESLQKCEDSLKQAILYARRGNYIDYGAMEHVSRDEFLSILNNDEDTLDEKTFISFKQDLEKAKKLVYIVDNCGEIVLDKILIEEIKKKYPDLEISIIVRGMPVINDATESDAKYVELDKYGKIISNGSGVAGTDMSHVSEETLKYLNGADILISKGQGNFETLMGCSLNIYYLFLCKCDLFVRRFGLEKFSGVFLVEKDIRL